jgi:hypothetical protein
MTGPLSGAMKEAAAGLLDAKAAADTLESVFLEAVAKPPVGPKQGKARTGAVARNEWAGLLSWAVAQGLAADPAETRERVDEKVPPPFTEIPFEGLHTPNGSTPGDTSEPETPARYTATDDGNALKLITEHRHRLRRVADMKKMVRLGRRSMGTRSRRPSNPRSGTGTSPAAAHGHEGSSRLQTQLHVGNRRIFRRTPG